MPYKYIVRIDNINKIMSKHHKLKLARKSAQELSIKKGRAYLYKYYINKYSSNYYEILEIYEYGNKVRR